jgi:hypothetical protein
VIAEPLSLEDQSHFDVPQPFSQPIASAASAPVEPPVLTLASVTSSLQLILATRRAARLSKDLPNS